MKYLFLLSAIIFNQFCYSQLISEFPPYLPSNFSGIPLNAGRCHSIAVNPTNKNIIIISNQIGGLWKTVNGGINWYHLNGLNAVLTNDVCFGPDGNTVICTRNADNRVDNGGGIWVSRDAGETWARPATGKIPVFSTRTTSNGAAFGISYDPDSTGKIFVGTTSGIAISSDNGFTWRHAMLENSSRIDWEDKLQNEVLSVLAMGNNVFHKNIVFALCRTGVYKSNDGGLSWENIKYGDFTFMKSFKLMDVWENNRSRGLGTGIFILKNYNQLLLYEDFSNQWTNIALPGGDGRGPFVRVSKATTPDYQTLWIGSGVSMHKITKGRLATFKSGLVGADSWELIGRGQGIHDDCGFMGIDGDKNIALFGSDGGVFKPLNAEGSRWASAGGRGSGMNSFQITDIAITNYHLNNNRSHAEKAVYYFTTQDNAIWSSADKGLTWPNYDCSEGFSLEVESIASVADVGLQVAYGKVGGSPSSNMFSHVFLTDQRMVPTTGSLVADLVDSIMSQAFMIGGDSYFRFRSPIGANLEGYASNDKGNTWRKRYDYVDIGPRGVLHSSKIGVHGPRRFWIPFATNPITSVITDAEAYAVYMRNFGPNRIGLLLHTYPFRSGVVAMNKTNIIYLPNYGSLGIRATEFDWQAVFGVNPIDYLHIIAPDVVNGLVKVTNNGGRTWKTDTALTKLVTSNNTIKMFNEYIGIPHVEVTQISWDPYHNNRILVGTRENGVMISEDNGTSWRKINESSNMMFVTGFAFQPDNTIIVSTYGRGLWKIDLNVILASPAVHYSCTACQLVNVDLTAATNTGLSNYSVIEIRGGELIRIETGKNKKPVLFVSDNASYKAWLPETGNIEMPEITRTKEQPSSNIALLKKQCKDCVVSGVLLKGNTLAGYITNKEIIPLNNEDLVSETFPEIIDNGTGLKDEGSLTEIDGRPDISIAGKLYISGLPVIGLGDKLTIIMNDINSVPTGSDILINGVLVQKLEQINWRKEKNGYRIIIDLPENLFTGLHQVSVRTRDQKVFSASFISAHMDNFLKK
ncbi:MAG: hypothetical protein WCH29_11450 [Chitinophagaceae bacterium]